MLVFMGCIRDRQLTRCSQVFLKWFFFLHKAVTDICPWQPSLPRGSCHLPLCATPLLLMAAAASGTCWKSLQGGGSLLWTLVQGRCWALQAAFIYCFEVANIPLMVHVPCSENISSLNLSLSQEWESVTDKALAKDREGSPGWGIRWCERELVSGIAACTTEFLPEAVILRPAAQMLVRVLFSGFPNQLQEPHGHSKPVLDDLLWGIQ